MAVQRRMVYAQILGSHRLNSRSIKHRYLYIGTILLADDDGRLNIDPKYLKGQVFSYDDDVTISEIKQMVDDLSTDGQLTVYEVDGSVYGEHPKWSEWQKIRGDMYTQSKIPSSKQARNELVTEMLQDSTLSKVKLSKDKLNKVKGEPTPRDLAIKFFEMIQIQDLDFQDFVKKLATKGISAETARNELVKFHSYWTELNSTGKHQRWEKEKTFEVQKRLNTWLSRAGKWSNTSQIKSRGFVM